MVILQYMRYIVNIAIGIYLPLIQAVMMQESGGIGNDPMQASECSYNVKW